MSCLYCASTEVTNRVYIESEQNTDQNALIEE